MRWTEGPLLGFDTEDTGADPMTCYPVAYAFVLRRVGGRMSALSSIVDPPAEIEPGAEAVHGISQQRAAVEGQPTWEALAVIREKIEWAAENDIPLVAFNASFDLTICSRLIDGLKIGNVLDPFVLDKHISYRKGKRTLSACAEFYGVSGMTAHDAAGDAATAILVLLKQAEQTQWLPVKTPAELHRNQEHWALDQKKSLSDYFVKQGKPPIPETEMGWPVQTAALAAQTKEK